MAVPPKLHLPAPEPHCHSRPLPRRAIAAACFCNLAHFYAVCSLFSYAGVMSADMGWAADRDHAGEIAGFLQSSNVIGRLPTSLAWGRFASRFGLRKSLVLSMLSLVIGGVSFGCCTAVVVAVVVRFTFFGMGNGWMTTQGPIAFELGGEEGQTEVMGKILAVGTLGQLLGPAVGGWTYGVVEGVPGLFPSLVGTCIAAAALVALWAWMPPSHAEANGCDAGCGTGNGDSNEPSTTPGLTEVICTWPLPLLIIIRSIRGFLAFAFFEVVPLWAISSTPLGGLALTETALGSIFAASGLISATVMAFGIKPVTAGLGLRRAAVLGHVVCLVCFVVMPFLPDAIALVIVHASTSSGMAVLESSYIAMINNSVKPAQHATVNGICVTFDALAKGVGPMSTAIAFAWSLSHWGISGHAAVFFGMAFTHIMLIIGTAILPNSVEPSGIRGVPAQMKSSPVAPSCPDPSLFGTSSSGGIEKDLGQRTVLKSRCGANLTETSSTEDASLQERAVLVESSGMAQAVWMDESSTSAELSEKEPLAV